MAKTRPKGSSSKKRQKNILNRTGAFSAAPVPTDNLPTAEAPTDDVRTLLAAAAEQLLHSPVEALPLAARAVQQCPSSLPALEQLAEIHVELGDMNAAHALYARAAALDPAGAPESAGGSGPDKFLWLAQLSPAGGADAVAWYERGAASLRALIAAHSHSRSAPHPGPDRDSTQDEHALQAKLVSALCGLAELYLSDLCMEPDAEARCEAYVAEALLVAPASPEALQTLASVRISQQRMPDAVAALDRALAALAALPAPDTPSYAARIALARLLIECARYEPALALLERLQAEHDQLPDLWYLGGWALFLLGEGEGPAGRAECWDSARDWLRTCEKVSLSPRPLLLLCFTDNANSDQLYKALKWEDEGIKEHACELLAKISEVVPETTDADADDDDGEEDEWEDDDDDDDNMEDS